MRLRAKERGEREIKRREPNPRLVVPATKQEEGRKGGVLKSHLLGFQVKA